MSGVTKIRQTSKIGTTSLQGTKVISPKCPYLGGSTVYPPSTRWELSDLPSEISLFSTSPDLNTKMCLKQGISNLRMALK